MAKEFNFAEYDFAANEACSTPEELDTLKRLDRTGTPVFLAPIEIEDRNQFESLHITQAHCRTWRIGSEQVLVHLTPADEATYRFLLNELRSKHRKGYRSVRCMVPGRQQPTKSAGTASSRLVPNRRSPITPHPRQKPS